MQLVISPAESARLDAASPEPVDTLMERAGLGVALAAAQLGAAYGARVAVLAGPGNNGGDGYVAARYLQRRGCAVVVRALAMPRPDSAAARAAEAAVVAGVPIAPLGDPGGFDLVIDALFGVGFHGSLPPEVMPWLAAPAPVLAVDIPSGLDAVTGTTPDRAFTAVRTVTFHALKPGHLLGAGPEHCGITDVIDIGLVGGDPDLMVCEDVDAPRPRRRRTAHKWSAGSVLVVGASPGISGAAVLAAKGALEMGAGAVAVAYPGGLGEVATSAGPGIMTRPVGSGHSFTSDDVAEVAEKADRFDVVVLGPGLGPETGQFVSGVLDAVGSAVVLDADGITSLGDPATLAARTGSTVITPHTGEFTALTGEAPDYRVAADIAVELGVVFVLKGNPTFVLGGERWVVVTGGPELATIGTGDVLSGMIAALLARGLDAETAARSAAHWHGRAGAALSARWSVTAERLASEIGGFAW